MREKMLTNKLSIYLIKSEYTEHPDILKNFDDLTVLNLQNGEIFYYGESFSYQPMWIKKFFGESLGDNHGLFNASSKGVLLVDIEKNGNKKIFAITFGYGWQFLKNGVFEERFGLKTALSIVDADNLRKINKKNMSASPKDTSEQLTKTGIVADFGIDIEQDLMCSITGKSKDDANFGKTITGKDALSVSIKRDLSSIKEFLELCYEKYLSDGYKKDFAWIDQIAEIKDPKLLNELNNKLVEYLKKNEIDKIIWMAVPEIVEWENVGGFKYKKYNMELKEDIYIMDFLDSLTNDEKVNLDLDFLRNKDIYCMSAESDEVKYYWSVYNCIYCEVTDDKKTFLLSNGKWYEIEKDFVNEVNSDFQSIRDRHCEVILPEYTHNNEADYNEAISSDDPALFCMDRKIISHGGGYGKIEFCDILTKNKKLIHVKQYGGSSVLSHLFSQGLVSGELFLRDNKFRDKVNEKLSADFKILNTSVMPIASEYEIIFGVISSSQNNLELPFFSKVSLRSAKGRLETFGYKVSLLKISVNK